MKNARTRISANEINRFMYCPHQWYYKRYYGTAELNEKYKALGIESSTYEAHLIKGLDHHKKYYFKYNVKRVLQALVGLTLLLGALGMVIEWNI